MTELSQSLLSPMTGTNGASAPLFLANNNWRGFMVG